MERYFAQCQAHRTSPHPAFVAGLREGAMDINFAEIPLADIRLFAHALLDVSPAARAARSPAARSRNTSGQLSRRDAASDTSPSSRPRTSAFSRTQFAKLHFSYNATVPAAQLPCGAASPPASTPWFTQNEPTLRRLPQAVAQAVKESATTLSSFSWCGMPLTSMAVQGRAPLQQQRGIGRVLPSLTRVLPLCHCLTSLRLDGVPLSHAQFMQLTTPFPKSPEASADGGVTWPALEEASFVGCGLTDACKNGLVHLIRAAVPTASDSTWQRSLRGGYANLDDRLLPRPAGGTVPLGHSATRGLKGLDASQNPLGDETARAVANAVPGSALRYLNMSSTSITWMGGSLLASRPVLEGTAMELLDMSNTGVSEVFSHAGGAAEAKMLVESSAAAGFRVLARGMGQLLVLRESDRSPQQSWLIQTTTAIAPQPSPASAPEPPHVESPTIPTCPPASVIEMERTPTFPQAQPMLRRQVALLLVWSKERRVSTPPADDPIDVAAETSVPLPSPTSSGEKHDKEGGGSFTGGLSNPPDAASTASQAAAVAASASDDLVHRASETAGDRKFLLALISRLEAHESDVTERLEAQYQRTTAQLTSLEKDMRFRLQQLADADRKERAAAADRQTALLEALAALRAEPVAVSAEGMTETMLLQLMHLIEAGMGKVQTALGAEGAVGTKSARAGESRVSPLLRSKEAATHVGAATITDRDLVKTASQRLKELGW
ncbi:hypothetical protein CGC20_27970 [Leishmania donovani]|uniref:Leucine Rich repeat family protein n=1 Tax=Leishmania donovani TaxID=5661 RepID=A0A504WZG8_LEIDO|nr:hypothetical protein CGC20_27970 [Leishmania donovani]